MRWLTKYPITADEVRYELDAIQIHVGPDSPVGSISPVVRSCIKTFFDVPENMDALVEHMKVK
jgi:hypothetical protein